MTRIMRASDLIGMPVVTLDEARIIGEVRDVLFDPRESRIAGFTLRGRGLLSPPLLGFLPAESIHSAGNDAVMVPDGSVLVREKEAIKQRIADQREAPGAEVITVDGVELGLVGDIVLESAGDRLRVVGYCLEREDGRELIVPAPEGQEEWSEQIVVPSGTEQLAVEGLVGFSRELERARQRRSAEGSQRSASLPRSEAPVSGRGEDT
ncbi:MAG TPA: PRC-barrel domain-containing protein [Candidatus Limnocylindrales bacterium]|nr:PRC-barrel domain-containing protein [Candidatus Limnocylindrales bacterium]